MLKLKHTLLLTCYTIGLNFLLQCEGIFCSFGESISPQSLIPAAGCWAISVRIFPLPGNSFIAWDDRVYIFIAFRWRGFTSRQSNHSRSFRTSWCGTVIGRMYQNLQRFKCIKGVSLRNCGAASWEYYKIIWFYQLSWQCELATVKRFESWRFER